MLFRSITERALPFLLRRLHDAGISATPHTDEHTGDIYLKVDGWRRINVENLIDELAQTDPSKHEVTIERWVAFIMESGRIAEQSVTDPDELRQRVRTRIIPANLAANPHLSYARPFPGGLADPGAAGGRLVGEETLLEGGGEVFLYADVVVGGADVGIAQ